MKDAGKDNMSQCTQKRREEAGSGQVGYVGLEIPTSLCDELVEERRGEKVWEHQSITLLSLSHTREGASLRLPTQEAGLGGYLTPVQLILEMTFLFMLPSDLGATSISSSKEMPTAR